MSKPEDYATAPTAQEAANRQRNLSTTPATKHGECPVTRPGRQVIGDVTKAMNAHPTKVGSAGAISYTLDP